MEWWQIGYRHFDTAKIYGSEEALGTALGPAISCGSVQREDIFVTSKLWSSDHHDPISALTQTLKWVSLDKHKHSPTVLWSSTYQSHDHIVYDFIGQWG